jgi:hypothetical protein
MGLKTGPRELAEIALGQACGIAGSVCMSDGSCGPNLGLGNFTYTPSNFNPNSVQFYGDRASTNGSATFDTTTSTFGGAWAVRPIVNQVMTPTGPAVVLAAEGFDIVGNLRVLGDKPIIFASTDTFELRYAASRSEPAALSWADVKQAAAEAHEGLCRLVAAVLVAAEGDATLEARLLRPVRAPQARAPRRP